ncbi:similar to Saccharomyces cerevisiae YNL314W DAL82 Positive regulator of allophanate inducible genes [Maudiozyma saulgeensis]|uniref:Similar to Saccharomyces cerevisiae YNL314W DAL82 Positive regulator of allophanate inducible genes n=1 Tax=Maudiozyma saulgeensis TaxID=1789683 RepID=A0A1X7R1F3_9SACH|nr:similar to Saccharomyces cerevisiae YNL314W DAL82 Positive regulator of allophanate inducible genes [Kazachstania saulgeensis]
MSFKSSKSIESIDLLVELLEVHKPHLKPYSERLKSWIDLLEEYNDVAGTHYKQSRTLKKRFERVVDAYRVDKSLPACQNTDLLSKLIEEYNKPYRLLQKSDYGQNNLSRSRLPIQVDPSLYQVSNSANKNKNIELQDDNKKGDSTTFDVTSNYDTPLQTIREEENEPMHNTIRNHITRKNLKRAKGRVEKISGSIQGQKSGAMNDINSFDMDDLLRSEEQSKESSTQPPPLDTIALGMPRAYEDSDERGCSSDSAAMPSVAAGPTRYYSTSTNTNKTGSMYYQSTRTDLPKSIFFIDQNNKLVELTSTNGSNMAVSGTALDPEQPHPRIIDNNVTDSLIRHSELSIPMSQSANIILPSRRQEKLPSGKRYDKPSKPFKSTSTSSYTQESSILIELNEIRNEQQNFQNTIKARLDVITDLLLKITQQAKPIATTNKVPAKTKNIQQPHR